MIEKDLWGFNVIGKQGVDAHNDFAVNPTANGTDISVRFNETEISGTQFATLKEIAEGGGASGAFVFTAALSEESEGGLIVSAEDTQKVITLVNEGKTDIIMNIGGIDQGIIISIPFMRAFYEDGQVMGNIEFSGVSEDSPVCAGYSIDDNKWIVNGFGTHFIANIIGGTGININEAASGTRVSVDTTVVQEKLIAGENITINGNTISATGGSSNLVNLGEFNISYDESKAEHERFSFTSTTPNVGIMTQAISDGKIPYMTLVYNDSDNGIFKKKVIFDSEFPFGDNDHAYGFNYSMINIASLVADLKSISVFEMYPAALYRPDTDQKWMIGFMLN